ncbi:MAG: sensor domain-containing diguanylate cyclase [Pseudomonadota bacterium]
MKKPRLTPLVRLSLGLIFLIVALVLLMDMVGLFPKRASWLAEARVQNSQALATQAALLLGQNQMQALADTYQAALKRNPDLRSIGLREQGGHLRLALGEHGQWIEPRGGESTLDRFVIPVERNGQHWGQIEIAYQPLRPNSLLGWLREPFTVMIITLTVFGLLAIYLYLRRALQYLDPATVVPERVRQAFNTLKEGIVILDDEHRILLTNNAFGGLHSSLSGDWLGKRLDSLEWLAKGLGTASDAYPWVIAMRSPEGYSEGLHEFHPPDGEPINVIIRASPILDARERVRGCLVSFDDVTEVHAINQELRLALSELEQSRDLISAQNEELQKLANRDPMTGCLNRRAFFEQLDGLFAKLRAEGGMLCCIMSDIDHFKQFNDRYGHAVGDDVIRADVRVLQAGLRNNDLLCRYGGEEFCIVLPDTQLEQALEIAERLRADVEAHAGMSVRSEPGLRITASFGVSHWLGGDDAPDTLIDRADQALYVSKKSGRNRVTGWAEGMSAPG